MKMKGIRVIFFALALSAITASLSEKKTLAVSLKRKTRTLSSVLSFARGGHIETNHTAEEGEHVSKERDMVVLFDLDGTITDSERIHYQVFKQYLTKHGVDMTPDFFLKEIHQLENVHDDIQIFEKLFPQKNMKELKRMSYEKEELFRSICRTGYALPSVPGAPEFIHWLRKQGVQVGYVTNAPRANAEAMLAALGLPHGPAARERYGPGTVTPLVVGDECARGKPAPDPYLEAARQMGVGMDQVVVFEDSSSGAAAARAAEATVIGVCTSLSHDVMRRDHGATFTITDFKDKALREFMGARRQSIRDSPPPPPPPPKEGGDEAGGRRRFRRLGLARRRGEEDQEMA
mmetsp:Transcript_39710/g.58402  ORF Transcript_39710/g.58402 Transcript_39710/m.58402 type:complete len:347 (+) Transcript_39710:84-1124(+)